MVTAIQADPEVALGKLPSKEFFMFILLRANQTKRHYKLYLYIMIKLLRIFHFCILVAKSYKHLKKSNAACFYTPIVLKQLIVVQMWKQHEEGN